MWGKNYSAIAQQYALDVLEGRVVACKWTKLACQRHLDDLEKQGQGGYLYRFDEGAANRVCAFVEGLRHTKGKWARNREKLKLEPWQCFVLSVPWT